MNDVTVIVGAGQAGGDLASALRQQGYGGRIVLIGDEPAVPYRRPPLSKAFLSGDISWTNNGISIYVAAQNSAKQIAEDMDHAYFPVGVSGKPTELHLMYPVLAMNYTKYPQACKLLMAFMLEADNFNPWIKSAKGYLTHCLNAYDKNPVWTDDPKATVFRDVAKRTRTAGGLGSVGEKAATAIADFVIVDMFANYCTGREDVKGSISIAERQLKRIYR